MPEAVSVRAVTQQDVGVVAELVAALLTELDGQPVDLDTVSASTEQVLALRSVSAFLAVGAEAPVGVIVLNECAAIYAGGLFGEISELYVRPEWRSVGVAHALLDAARRFGQAREWRRLEVGAPPQPAWARTLSFYERKGFEMVGPRLRLRF